MTTLALVFTKIRNDGKKKYDFFYSHSKTETIINESDIGDIFESTNTTVILVMQKILRKDLGWIIDSVIDHNVRISKYHLLAGSI